MKRAIAAALCCALITGAVTGCGKQTDGVKASQETGTQAAKESISGTAVNTPKTEYDESEYADIDWFLSVSPIPAPWNLDMPVMAAISKKTGAVMNANIPAQDADTKLNLLMVNGQLPDVISITNETLYSELIKSGQVWDIQEFFETYLPEADIINGQFPEDVKQVLKNRDGGWYSIPSHLISVDNEKIWPLPDNIKEYYEGMKTANQFTIAFNRPMLEKYGISEKEIRSEAGLIETLKKVKAMNAVNKDGASIYPLMLHGDMFWKWTSEAVSNLFGAMPVDGEGNYQSPYYSDPFRDGMEFLNECYREGVLNPSIMTMDEASVVAMMNDDRAFCYIGGTAPNAIIDRKIKDDSGKETNDYVWMCPGPVKWESGYRSAIGKNSAVNAGWIQTFINKDCREPEAIARYINYMMSKEGLDLWNYGIEGTDWFRNDKGLIERTEEGQKAYENMATTGMGAFWLFANTDYSNSVTNITNEIDEIVGAVVGRSSETFIYDTIALQLPSGYIESGSKYDITNVEVENYVPQQLAKIILAEDETKFADLYAEFTQQLDKLGLRELDSYKNEAIQKNYREYGYTLKAVN